MGRLRWRQCKQDGYRPRDSEYHDGVTEYARVCALGGGWRPFGGWFFTARIGDEFINTAHTPVATVHEAKQQAEAWVMARLGPAPPPHPTPA
jgi:hypothetical protein